MKRNMDLIRAILLYVEEHDDGTKSLAVNALTLPDEYRTVNELSFFEHIALMKERGLIETDGYLIRRLTWEGHEFLDNSRSPEVWNAAKESAGHLSFGVFGSVLNHLAIHHGLGLLKSGYETAQSVMGGL